MDPISQAIDNFQQAFRAFRANGDLHLFRVETEARHVELLIKILRGEEWQSDNVHPLIVFPCAFRETSETLYQMKLLVVQHYGLLQKAFSEQAKSLPDLPLDPSAEEDPLAALVNALDGFVRGTSGHLAAPIVCWLPTEIKKPKAWQKVVTGLRAWMWPNELRLVLATEAKNSRVEYLGIEEDEVASHVFEIDEDANSAYFSTLMGPPSAGRAKGTLSGCAAPDVAPPPRPGPAEPSEQEIKAAAKEADLPPMLTTSEAEVLRTHVLTAARASADGDARKAIGEQKAACGLCSTAGVILEHAMMTLVLANYYLQFKMEEEAELAYREAERLACEAGAFAQISQIRLALGYLYLKNKDYRKAVETYEQAAAPAIIVQSYLLYIEALRLAGTAYLKLDDYDAARLCWLAVVQKGPEVSPSERNLSSFRDVAGALIDLLKNNGLVEQARSVQQLVIEVETTGSQSAEATL